MDIKDKDYIVVVQCHIVKQRCPGYLCEKAFHERAGGFSIYPVDKHYRVLAMTCGGCCGRALHRKLSNLLRKLKDNEQIGRQQIVVQLSSCMTKDNFHAPPCPHLDYIKALVAKLGLDLHNDWMKSIPYTLTDVQTPDNRKAHEKGKAVAEKSGFLVICEAEDQRRSFSYNLFQHAIAALTVELGESCVVNENNVRYGLRSIMNIPAYLEMVPKTEEVFEFPLPEVVRGRMLNFSAGPVSSASGIIRFLASPGDVVKKGQPVAKIYNTFGKLQATIPCAADGIVLGHSDSSVAFPGAPLMAFGNI